MKKAIIGGLAGITILGIAANAEEVHNTIYMGYDAFYAIGEDDVLYKIPYEIEEYEPQYVGDWHMDTICNISEPAALLDDVTSVNDNYAIKNDDTLWEWGHSKGEPFGPIKVMDNVKSVSSIGAHTLVVGDNGTLFGKGRNVEGQLAQGIPDENKEGRFEPYFIEEYTPIMEDVDCAKTAAYSSIVLKNDGTMWTFGSNSYHALGDEERELFNNEPEQILDNVKCIEGGYFSGFAMLDDEKECLLRWGSNYGEIAGGITKETYLQPTLYAYNIRAISNSWAFNYAVDNNNRLWLYGKTSEKEKINEFWGMSVETGDYIAHNVNYVSCDKGEFLQYALVLKNSGELMLLEFLESDEMKYRFTKLMDNVKLTFPVDNTAEFTDIADETAEAQNAIKLLAKSGITDGTGENTFSPQKTFTRAEIAAMLLRMTGRSEEKEDTDFSDVNSSKWYYDIAGVSQKYGIVQGFEDNTFRGNDVISGNQLISLTARVLRTEGFATIPDTSVQLPANIPDWAKSDVELAIRGGLITEAEAAELAVKDNITRAEAAVILYRLYDRI